MNIGKRVMVLGNAGSGKSTLSRMLGEMCSIPVVHLDKLFWLPNWVAREKKEIDKIIASESKKDCWVMDGNYTRTLGARGERADTIIFIDFNRFLCIFRVLKRRIKYNKRSREDITNGCNEKIDKEFLSWIWNFSKRMRPKILELLDYYRLTSDKNVVRLTTRKSVKNFLDSINITKESDDA